MKVIYEGLEVNVNFTVEDLMNVNKDYEFYIADGNLIIEGKGEEL